jgi:Smg protein
MDLVVLVAEMARHADQRPVELGKELLRRGYSAEEIDHAVFWFSSRPDAGGAEPRPGRSVRVLSEFERMSLSTAACGYLFRMQQLGIIDARQFETIVARAIPAGGDKVGVEDVKSIAYAVIFDQDPRDVEEDVLGHFDADGAPA